jgi:hypothetical protein
MPELVAHWGEIVGISGASEPSDLVGLFQFFRPEGAGVEAIFDGLPFGDAVLDRLRRCYECTARGFDASQPYFIPTPEVPCADSRAQELLVSHFSEMSQLAQQKQDVELVELLSAVRPQRVESAAELTALPVNDDSPDSWIYELVTDYIGSLPRPESPILLLRDAIYAMANDIFLRSYLLWPLYADAARRRDPFQAYFDLWSSGVSYSFRTADSCRYLIRPSVADLEGSRRR